MKTHGQQMGASGYGLTHGYSKEDDVDRDISHESKGGVHGVSQSWVAQKTKAGAAGASGANSGWAARRSKGGGKKHGEAGEDDDEG